MIAGWEDRVLLLALALIAATAWVLWGGGGGCGGASP